MLLATRCPFCETVFRLQPAQLALRRGLVRCGHCQEVFDASSSLYESAEGADFATATPVSLAAVAALSSESSPKAPDFSGEAWNPWAPQPDAVIDQSLRHNAANLPQASAAAGVAVTPRHADEIATPSVSVEAQTPSHREPAFAGEPEPAGATGEHFGSHVAPQASPEAVAEPAPVWRPVTRPNDEPKLQDAQAAAAAATLRTTPDREPHFGTAPAAASTTAASTAINPPARDADPFPVVRETRAAPPRQTGWRIVGAVVALVLLIGLLAQLAWWQRETIMVYWPDSQTLYVQACAPLGCTVLPPHDIDGLQVQPSELRQIDGPHKLELKMPLRNRYNVALAYPAIELTLLDDQNNVAVRRVLWPQDYVKPGTPISAGLPARTTQTMIVQLDTGDAVASNFRVQIFYP
jgi:predicted Zn finger-like uncharacterized protein